MAGGLAAVLSVATLIGLMVGSSRLGTAPDFITMHPIRAMLAIVCLASLLVLIALAVGSLVSRYASAPVSATLPRAPRPSAPADAHGPAPRGLLARHAPAAPGAQRGPHTSAPYDDRQPRTRGYAERPQATPTGPYRPGSPASRPDQRYRPPSVPAPRSVPMPPTEQRNPPRQ
jgi:hypothetical protein